MILMINDTESYQNRGGGRTHDSACRKCTDVLTSPPEVTLVSGDFISVRVQQNENV
jgi:hypothetical protein